MKAYKIRVSKITLLDKLMLSQFYPSEEDIKDRDVKELAERLRGDSDKDTLTNILEWEKKNMRFWWLRYPMDLSLKIITPISLMLIVMIISPLLSLLYYLKYLTSLLTIIIGIGIFFLIVMMASYFLRISFLSIAFSLIYLITAAVLRIPILAQRILPFTLFYAGCLGCTILIVFSLYIRYEPFFRDLKLGKKISFFFEIFNDTFEYSLPVSKILRYRLGVCKDYAKLTASLLLNLYPAEKIYFVIFLRHVACGIKINNKLYILDQHLPILTVEKWLMAWNRNKANIFKYKIEDENKEIINLSSWKISNIDVERLAKEVEKNLRIANKVSSEKCFKTTILLKKYAIYYDEDEIIKHSLIRSIKDKIRDEFCENMKRITAVKIAQEEENLILNIYYV